MQVLTPVQHATLEVAGHPYKCDLDAVWAHVSDSSPRCQIQELHSAPGPDMQPLGSLQVPMLDELLATAAAADQLPDAPAPVGDPPGLQWQPEPLQELDGILMLPADGVPCDASTSATTPDPPSSSTCSEGLLGQPPQSATDFLQWVQQPSIGESMPLPPWRMRAAEVPCSSLNAF